VEAGFGNGDLGALGGLHVRLNQELEGAVLVGENAS
jgi:hypothetical protein